MQRLQLYIEDNDGIMQLIDLFDDETVELTSTIQDVRDIGKVFTDYTQTFTVPASDTNNKIFRHFYNYFITGNAYDSRKKKKAKLNLNYMPFREGKVFLNSVNMKQDKPHGYVLTFYGSTVSLKDMIGDDELTDLPYLSNFNHDFDNDTVKSGLTEGIDFLINGTVYENSIIYPLITSKKRLFYNSSEPFPSAVLDADGNLYKNTSFPDDVMKGLKYEDLKPGIKLAHIIEAIEDKYGISFTRDIETTPGVNRSTFFNSEAFSNLYMWVNSKSGNITDIDDDEEWLHKYTVGGYIGTENEIISIDSTGTIVNVQQINGLNGSAWRVDVDTEVVLGLDPVKYKIVIKNLTTGSTKEKTFNSEDNETASLSTFFYSSQELLYTTDEQIQVDIISESDLNVVSVDVSFTRIVPFAPNVQFDYTTNTNISTAVKMFLQERMPKMKVLDFLTGLFKQFNLTAYFIHDLRIPQNGKIYVDTLDNFYLDGRYSHYGGMIDIDEYLDTTQHTVDSVLPFTDIKFQYEETNSVLMENHFEQFNEVFGDAEFNVRNAFQNPITKEYTIDRGTKYELKLPFSHLKYERILDTSNSPLGGDSETDIQWGYCATGDFSETPGDETAYPTIFPKGDYDKLLIKPLIFYGILQTGLTKQINYLYLDQDGLPQNEGLTSYWRPSNSSNAGDADTPPSYSLNFDQEFDEWQRINYGERTNSLYNVFYKSYVESVFNPTKRMFKVTALLPPSVIVNYKLNDQIKIQDQVFRINSITSNLNTGKTTLELLNITLDEIVQ
jgi:hypothetical protein